jgi:hypothetical protein
MEGKSAQLGGSELTQEAMQARSEGRAHALAQGRASDIALTPVLLDLNDACICRNNNRTYQTNIKSPS